MANEFLMYPIRPGKSVDAAVQTVKSCLFSDGMEVQDFFCNDCHIIQARTRSSDMKKLVGMDKAVEIRMSPSTDNTMVTVEIGGAQWADKAAAMTVSMFVLWPLAVTSGLGFYGQSQIIKKVKNLVTMYFGY